jgi:hypothetical protein
MKCIANRACQAYISDGKIKTFAKGDTFNFDKCPPNFTSLEKEKEIDFDLENLSEEQMIDAKVDRQILIEYAKKEYDKDLSRYKRHDSLVKAFCDARFRFIDKQQLKDMR